MGQYIITALYDEIDQYISSKGKLDFIEERYLEAYNWISKILDDES